jgi:hypothetical protein
VCGSQYVHVCGPQIAHVLHVVGIDSVLHTAPVSDFRFRNCWLMINDHSPMNNLSTELEKKPNHYGSS